MKIGLIAGSGQFPIIFAETARKKGYAVYAAAYHDETNPELKNRVDVIEWFYLGQLKRLINFFNLKNSCCNLFATINSYFSNNLSTFCG